MVVCYIKSFVLFYCILFHFMVDSYLSVVTCCFLVILCMIIDIACCIAMVLISLQVCLMVFFGILKFSSKFLLRGCVWLI